MDEVSWQPIETAPLNELVLICEGWGLYAVAVQREDDGPWEYPYGPDMDQWFNVQLMPYWWMPIPPLPQKE